MRNDRFISVTIYFKFDKRKKSELRLEMIKLLDESLSYGHDFAII